MNWEQILTLIVGGIFGGGGVFAYLTNRKSQKSADTSAAANEWKQLYDKMAELHTEQVNRNKALQKQVEELKEQVNKLSTDLESYRRFDTYISDLEAYIKLVLGVAGPLLSDESRALLEAQRPLRPIGLKPLTAKTEKKEKKDTTAEPKKE